MSVWMVCPSARPVAEVNARIEKWIRMGYRVALWRDDPLAPADGSAFAVNCNVTTGGIPCDLSCDQMLISSRYPGYPQAMNALVAHVFCIDPECDWVVCGSDDIDPDHTKSADEIARDCTTYFHMYGPGQTLTPKHRSTFGVMQPCGDRWGSDEPWAKQMYPSAPAYIDRICGSPWIGREFARRVNQGNGPWWPEYAHMFPDEELQCVAERFGVLLQRRDLTHYHDHCRRDQGARTPDFLVEAYSAAHWEKYQALFNERKSLGFPGSECIA